jgi:flagellar biosynthesis protein FliQ
MAVMRLKDKTYYFIPKLLSLLVFLFIFDHPSYLKIVIYILL